MRKQILFAHSGGAQGGPGKGSFDFVEWLRTELGKEFEILCPILEDPEAPTYEIWKSLFDKAFASLQNGSILVGHSLGGSTLVKYLSEEDISINIDALFLVSTPYWGKENWDVDEFKLIENFARHLPGITSVQLFHCKNDPIVSFDHMQEYKKALPQAQTHALDCDSHAFAEGLPELAKAIRGIYHE